MAFWVVFVDSCVVLDFLNSNCPGILGCFLHFVDENEKDERFCFLVTDYIYEAELKDAPHLETVREAIKVCPVPRDHFYTLPPPKDLDAGEWSIFLALRKLRAEGVEGCVLTNDKPARAFLKKEGLLPCKCLNPPHAGVGGTLGILRHLVERGWLTPDLAKGIVEKMRKAGSRFPVGDHTWLDLKSGAKT